MRRSRFKYFHNQITPSNFSMEDMLEFDAEACVEIVDPRKFIQCWQRALPPEALVTSGAIGDYQKYVCRRSALTTRMNLSGNVWAVPDLITTTKLKRFAYQEECRFAYTKTDALKIRERAADEHCHERLHLRDLHGICRIRVL